MTTAAPVSVLGLGAMGQALAHAFLAAGHPTTVWNRSPGRAAALVAAGAVEATSAAEAAAASPLVVVCVLDRAAVEVVLDAAGEAVAGRTIVNLTSAVPDDAAALAALAAEAGAAYLDGKILVTTGLVGTEHALVLYAGDRATFDAHVDTLRALGGDADHLGPDPALAATFDLAMLSIFFNGMASFLHALALVGADGVDAVTFLPYAERILGVLQVVHAEMAAEVDAGHHPGAEDNLVMEARALDHLVETSAARGIDVTVPAVVRTLARTAIADGHGTDGFSRVIDVLRRPAEAAEPAA